ncbi:MAG: SIMPL domain-containing protein [Spirochaetia bacterium]
MQCSQPVFGGGATCRLLTLSLILSFLLIPFQSVSAGGQAEAPEAEASRTEAPQAEASQSGAPETERTQPEASSTKAPRRETPASGTVTVVGRGEVTAVPDQATITVGVQVFDEDAQAASAELSDRMDAVVAALQEAGVPEEHIRTTNYSIFFERDREAERRPERDGVQDGDGGPAGGGSPGDGGRPAGTYRVQNMVRVLISEVDRAATIVDTAIEAGANQMHGIRFSLSDPASLDGEALTRAMDHARDRAETLAEAGGQSLGTIIEITESSSGSSGGFEVRQMDAGMGGGPVQPGEARHTARVRVTYELE